MPEETQNSVVFCGSKFEMLEQLFARDHAYVTYLLETSALKGQAKENFPLPPPLEYTPSWKVGFLEDSKSLGETTSNEDGASLLVPESELPTTRGSTVIDMKSSAPPEPIPSPLQENVPSSEVMPDVILPPASEYKPEMEVVKQSSHTCLDVMEDMWAPGYGIRKRTLTKSMLESSALMGARFASAPTFPVYSETTNRGRSESTGSKYEMFFDSSDDGSEFSSASDTGSDSEDDSEDDGYVLEEYFTWTVVEGNCKVNVKVDASSKGNNLRHNTNETLCSSGSEAGSSSSGDEGGLQAQNNHILKKRKRFRPRKVLAKTKSKMSKIKSTTKLHMKRPLQRISFR